ncbi:MAG: ComF family protein, partial [Verrucomicrobiota bacterium]
VCRQHRSSSAEGYVCPECWLKVQFVTEPFCERCGLPYDGEITGPFECSKCREMELHFRSARSAVIANPFLLEIIHRYKYSHALWFEPFLVDLLLRQAKPVLEKDQWDFIVPVPLHPLKKRQREFNQAERLAAHLGRATQIAMNPNLLERIEFTRSQTRLTRPQRSTNMRNAFAMKNRRKLHGEKIILLDDVLTTGARTSACARILQKAGAGEICVWTIARGQ